MKMEEKDIVAVGEKGERKWKGVISRSRKLGKQSVICLFSDGWKVSATADHTHSVDFLHLRKKEVNRNTLELAKKYFQLAERLKEKYKEKYSVCPKEKDYFKWLCEIDKIGAQMCEIENEIRNYQKIH